MNALTHLGGDEVAVELIQLRQPEIVAGVISVGAAVWIAAQVTEVLHQHERAVEFILSPELNSQQLFAVLALWPPRRWWLRLSQTQHSRQCGPLPWALRRHW